MIDSRYFELIVDNIISWHFLGIVCVLLVLSQVSQRYNLVPRFSVGRSRKIAFACLCFLIIAITCPYWLGGALSSTGNTDDLYVVLVGKLMAKYLGTGASWVPNVSGGTDLRLLQGSSPFSLIYVYVKLFPFWLIIPFVIFVNIVLATYFSYRILSSLLSVAEPYAMVGAFVAGMLQGYYVGNWPDAHISNLHGMALIPVFVYVFDVKFEGKYFYLLSLLSGLFYGFASTAIILNLLPMGATLFLWLVFAKQKSYLRIINAVSLLFLGSLIPYIENINAIHQFTLLSARQFSFENTVILDSRFWLCAFLFAMVVLFFSFRYGKCEYVKFLKMQLAMVFGIPVLAYSIQSSGVMPFYRWSVFYDGNYAIPICLLFYFLYFIYLKTCEKSRAVAYWLCSVTVVSVVVVFANIILNSFAYDLWLRYQSKWNYVVKNSVIKKMIDNNRHPFRTISYGTFIPMTYMGWYNGIEDAGGYTGCIPENTINAWKSMKRRGHENVRHLYVEWDESRGIPHLSIPLLKAMNVEYILSKYPLNDDAFVLYDSKENGNEPCADSVPPYARSLFGNLGPTISDMACRITHRDYLPSMYVYKLKDTFPRAYFASKIIVANNKKLLTNVDLDNVDRQGAYVNTITPILEGNVNPNDKERTIVIEKYSAGFLSLNINASSSQFVLVSQSFNPYWRLFVNGKENKLYQANLIQMGFVVEPGQSNAVLRYCPDKLFQNSCGDKSDAM